jgi:hypothetical protein
MRVNGRGGDVGISLGHTPGVQVVWVFGDQGLEALVRRKLYSGFRRDCGLALGSWGVCMLLLIP